MFKGQRLNRFTPRRQDIATELGMKWGQVPEEDQIVLKIRVPAKVGKRGSKKESEEIELPSYRGIRRDAKMVVWLCLQPESKIAHIEEAGKRGLEETRADIAKWADKENLNIGSESQNLVETIFLEIMFEIHEARSTPVPKREVNDDDDDDEPED